MYKDKCKNDLNCFLEINNYDVTAQVVYSDFEDYHYQTPIIFALKKKYPEFKIEDLVVFLKDTGNYSKVELTGNSFISLKCKLEPMDITINVNKTILVDYCGVNVAKQMHIGHIRSMFIGDFIVRLHEHAGDKVIIHNHIGDWGNQFGFLLNYIQENKLENDLTNKKLTQYYKEAYKKNEESEEFAKHSAEVAYELQNFQNKDLYKLWKKLVDISMSEALTTFEDLNLKISGENTQGESFYAPMCKAILEDLLSKNIATKTPDGAIVVFFDNKSPLVLQKSNGNFLYALYDLTAIKWRVENINPDKIIYVVDKRQSLHFEQVFEVAINAKYTQTTELVHLGFGTILGKDKKPLKTKSGESLYLDELLESGKEILLKDNHFINMNEVFKKEILHKTIIGGMKYYDLKFSKQQDYIFDWEHVLNFTGGSAPYVQNALVRIDSILYKTNYDKVNLLLLDFNHQWSELENTIIFQCQKLDEIIGYLNIEYSSQTLTGQMIKVCQYFHKYYESEKIIGSSMELFKLQLLIYIQEKLNISCDILGIEVYQCEQILIENKELDNNIN
jgi:arginyl-tRNA synthetase